MNQVEARSSRGIFPDVRGMCGYRSECSCQRYEQQMPDMFRCRPSSSIPTEEFLPDSLPGACRRDSINAPSELVGIWNQHPEGSCDAEEFCCNEFAAALLTPGGCLPWLSTVYYM